MKYRISIEEPNSKDATKTVKYYLHGVKLARTWVASNFSWVTPLDTPTLFSDITECLKWFNQLAKMDSNKKISIEYIQ